MSDKDHLTEEVKYISERLVHEHFPRELILFESIWNSFWQILGCESILELAAPLDWSCVKGPIVHLGALRGESGAEIDTLYVIGTLSSTIWNLLKLESDDLTRDAILGTIENEARRLQVPPHVLRVLREYATGLLAGILAGEGSRSGERSKQRDGKEVDQYIADRGKEIYIDRMLHGKRRKNGWCSTRVIQGNRENLKYDIIVDEHNHEIIVKQVNEKRIRKINETPRMQRGMLWLVLANCEKAIIRHEDIRRILKVQAVDTAIYQYKKQLGNLLGEELRDRIMDQGKYQCYNLYRDRWSYCWLRHHEDADQSELINIEESRGH